MSEERLIEIAREMVELEWRHAALLEEFRRTARQAMPKESSHCYAQAHAAKRPSVKDLVVAILPPLPQHVSAQDVHEHLSSQGHETTLEHVWVALSKLVKVGRARRPLRGRYARP